MIKRPVSRPPLEGYHILALEQVPGTIPANEGDGKTNVIAEADGIH